MGKELLFTKMQGTGNDYVYVNGFDQEICQPCQLARKISDRHFGVGSDGLVLILPSAIADVRMRMFNPDGTEAEMCGNASRCVGKYVYENGLVRKNIISLETRAGVKLLHLSILGNEVTAVTVDMGEPILTPELVPVSLGKERCLGEVLTVDDQEYAITAVSMGNPHAVIFMENVDSLELPVIGPKFETHTAFPQKTNTEFIEVLSSTHIKMRVWERGTGETLACGTGACAAVVACVLNGLTDRKVTVDLKGGTLFVEWNEGNNHVFMTGPAVTVFTGKYYLESM